MRRISVAGRDFFAWLGDTFFGVDNRVCPSRDRGVRQVFAGEGHSHLLGGLVTHSLTSEVQLVAGIKKL